MVLVALVACTAVSSPDVPNAELYAEVLVSTDGASTEVDAKLQQGQGLGWQPVAIGGDEALLAVIGDEATAMDEVDLGLGTVGYVAVIDAPSGGTSAGVRFQRSADDSFDTVLTVPSDFTITAPNDGDYLYGDTTTVVTWDATADDGVVEVTVAGSCIPGFQVSGVADVGYVEVPGGALAAEGASCAATVTVVRYIEGELPAEWGAGGWLQAQSGRMVTVVIVG